MQNLDRELTIWAVLEHRYVLRMYGTVRGFGFFRAIVTPWMPNGTLNDYLHRADLTAMDSLSLVSLFARSVMIIYRFLNSSSKLWKVSSIVSRNELTMEATDVTDYCAMDQFTTTA
jgi:hypothetical protein